MKSTAVLNGDVILDAKGEPLRRDYAQLLKSINHLMTVGTYYSLEHEQYVLASRKAAENIVSAMGEQPSLTLEIGAEGLMCGGQTIPTNHREVRQLHDLLVPLNIARVEIDRGLNPSDLRTALAVFHHYRRELGTSSGFHEVNIEGLPGTVRTVGCSLFADDDVPGSVMPQSMEELARSFLELVGKIIANMDAALKHGFGALGAGEAGGCGAADIRDLAENLRQLARTESDPHKLLHLIQSAQKALELSRDPGSVDMVFRLLRTELEPKAPPPVLPRGMMAPESRDPEVDLAPLGGHLDVTLAEAATLGPMTCDGTKSDFLGICYKIMLAEPSSSLQTHLTAACEVALGDPLVDLENVKLCARWMSAAIRHNRTAVCDQLLESTTAPLRREHPKLLAQFWRMLWERLDNEQRGELWPFLVNDVLLGLGDVPKKLGEDLLKAVGSVNLHQARATRQRLYGMSAFEEDQASSRIFSVAPGRLYALHATLLFSPLAQWHGPRLQRQLLRSDGQGLMAAVIRLLGDFQLENAPLLAWLLEQEATGMLSPETKEAVVILLGDGLSNLVVERRREDWTTAALGWLDRLDHAAAEPVLNQVLNQRRFLFLKAWPRECRIEAERRIAAWNNASAT
ncbi:hypothetical protein COW53_05460 [bacterium CG17_big_fil_post_rev_8_21_14_2_50_64_8]|nr:MAG: hypothetical protein COW53_05460 [bacterium CG17_big_fil_post_rev_8_21_14_2_50_64_8]PJA75823.1 MAG: hypothetical protein CO151_04665 [bacterium CG_4_9_14_3_um_filter_65_15]